MALFYLNDLDDLMPIAIQMYQQPGEHNPVSLMLFYISIIAITHWAKSAKK